MELQCLSAQNTPPHYFGATYLDSHCNFRQGTVTTITTTPSIDESCMLRLLWGHWTVRVRYSATLWVWHGRAVWAWKVTRRRLNSFYVTPGEILPLVSASRSLLRFSGGGHTELLQTLTWANITSSSQHPHRQTHHSVWVNLASGLLLLNRV